jgi:hypothetical protein
VTKGDLVQVMLGGTDDELGEVLDYRPEVLGGSSSTSWRDQTRRTRAEFVTTPKRGEVLILFYEDGSISWIDELRVTPLT